MSMGVQGQMKRDHMSMGAQGQMKRDHMSMGVQEHMEARPHEDGNPGANGSETI